MSTSRQLIRIWAAAAAAPAALLAGCSQHARYDDPVWLAVRGPVAVDVDTFNGDVLVTGDPKQQYAMVQVKRVATHGSGRGKEAQQAVDSVKYSVDMVQSETGPVLKVRSWTDAPEPWFLRTDVRIFIPAVRDVTVHTSSGKVTAINVEGQVNIETSGGDVRLMTNLPMVRPVTINNRFGDIDYRVRGESTGLFECRSVGGSVDQRARYGHLIIHIGTNNETLLATLNDGQNPVRLHTEDGNIRVAVVENPTDVGALIMTP